LDGSVAQVFAREGARLTLVDINEEGLRKTLTGLPEGRAIGVPADVSRSNDVRSAIDTAMSKYGRLTTMANCHGISLMEDTRIVDVPEETFDRTIAVNLRSIFLLCKYAVPALKQSGGGAIVNLASSAALGGGGGTSYTASKGGSSRSREPWLFRTRRKESAATRSVRDRWAHRCCRYR
jgi:NAD(P)-dependent dehydrogenase (short-subunit alcohol dehydrogenase family)